MRDEDVFRGVDSNVKNFLVSIPLVADLRSPAMRDRHWGQLMATTGKAFDVKDPQFKLNDLLQLELHKFEEEVGAHLALLEGRRMQGLWLGGCRYQGCGQPCVALSCTRSRRGWYGVHN